MALRDQPYIPLYIQDFLTDEKLIECSAKATGVYVRLMCIMHKSEDYGKILLKQKDKQSQKQIENFAVKIGKQMPYSEREVLESLQELLNEKVLCIEGDFLVQKRMVKDNLLSLKRAEAGSKGGKFAQAKAKPKVVPNTENETVIEIGNEILKEYKKWTDEILAENDAEFQELLFTERWKIPGAVFDSLARDHLGLLHRYPKMRPQDQQSFRYSLLKHIRENKDKPQNGKQPNQRASDAVIEQGKSFGTFD